MRTQSKTNEILTEHFRKPIMLGHTAFPEKKVKKNKRLEISKILYRNSTDNDTCLMIKFENIEIVIDLLEKL
jgi:hypothetical protein